MNLEGKIGNKVCILGPVTPVEDWCWIPHKTQASWLFLLRHEEAEVFMHLLPTVTIGVSFLGHQFPKHFRAAAFHTFKGNLRQREWDRNHRSILAGLNQGDSRVLVGTHICYRWSNLISHKNPNHSELLLSHSKDEDFKSQWHWVIGLKPHTNLRAELLSQKTMTSEPTILSITIYNFQEQPLKWFPRLPKEKTTVFCFH